MSFSQRNYLGKISSPLKKITVCTSINHSPMGRRLGIIQAISLTVNLGSSELVYSYPVDL